MDEVVKLLDLRMTKGEKATRAFVDIEIYGIKIKDFRVYQPNGNPSPMIRNPFTNYRSPTKAGSISYRQIVDLPPSIEKEVHVMILSEYYRRAKEKDHGAVPRS